MGEQEAASNAITPALVKRLRDLIENGELPLGSKLPPERELAQKLNVSRPSLRQAMKALETMGLLVSRVGIGNFVRDDILGSNLLTEPIQFAIKLNNISRSKLYEMRQVLEVQLVGLTAVRAGEQDLAAIRTELEAMASHRDNPRLMAGTDYRFHLEIIRACGNEIFQLLYEPVSKLLWEDLRERMHLFDPDYIVGLHREIYAAIEKRDAAGAMEAMRLHLEVGYTAFYGATAGSKLPAAEVPVS